jgi:hypothetical protein
MNDPFFAAIKASVTYGDRYGAIKALPDDRLTGAIKALEYLEGISNLTMNQESLLSALNFERENRMPCGNCEHEQCRHCS